MTSSIYGLASIKPFLFQMAQLAISLSFLLPNELRDNVEQQQQG